MGILASASQPKRWLQLTISYSELMLGHAVREDANNPMTS